GVVEQLRHRFLIRLELQSALGGLLKELGPAGAAAEPVDGAICRNGRQPGALALRHSVDRPAPQRLRERLLRALLGQVPVAGPPDQRGDDATPLLAGGRINRALDRGRGMSGGLDRFWAASL